MNSDYQFEKLDFAGMKTLVQWAEAEGWNPGLHDASLFWATDPDGFYGYYHHNKLIAGGSIVSYGGQFGFMGFFIVKAEYRGSGIGRKLWIQRRDALLGRLNSGAAIGMDGVLAMQSFYSKGGFEIAFRDERYVRTGRVFQINPHISSITCADYDSVLAYDRQCFGFGRPQFLIPWITQPQVKTFKYTADGILMGFAVVRKAINGHKVGPLFADNALIAEELYKACLNSVADEQLFIDIPVVNAAAGDLVKKYKATYVFECARMYYGKAPAIPIGQVFGLTTFELG